MVREDHPLTRVGLEARPLSQWLYAGLVQAGLEVVLLETRHVKAARSALIVKTDRRDAGGIAQLLRMGWIRPVHCKSPPSRLQKAVSLLSRFNCGPIAGLLSARLAEYRPSI